MAMMGLIWLWQAETVTTIQEPPGFFPGLPAPGPKTPQQVSDVVNRLLQGKFNNTFQFTLNENTTSTQIQYPLIGTGSSAFFMPLTANAAAEIAAGTMYVSSRAKGALVISHANAATTDRTFNIMIVG
jgi:hypothetical protein